LIGNLKLPADQLDFFSADWRSSLGVSFLVGSEVCPMENGSPISEYSAGITGSGRSSSSGLDLFTGNAPM